MRIRYLLDEHLPPVLKQAVKQRDARIDILRVGDTDAPPLSAQDPDILLWCSQESRLLVTNDRRSMLGHLKMHRGAGKHHWGILWVRPKTSIGKLAFELHLAWEFYEADEWRDLEGWIPF